MSGLGPGLRMRLSLRFQCSCAIDRPQPFKPTSGPHPEPNRFVSHDCGATVHVEKHISEGEVLADGHVRVPFLVLGLELGSLSMLGLGIGFSD